MLRFTNFVKKEMQKNVIALIGKIAKVTSTA